MIEIPIVDHESLSFVARAKEITSTKFKRREGRVVAWTRALLVPPLNTSENIYIHVDAHARGSRRGEDRSVGALYTCEPRQFVVTCLECAHRFREYCTICESRKIRIGKFPIYRLKESKQLRVSSWRDCKGCEATSPCERTLRVRKEGKKKGERCARTSRSSPFLFHKRLSVTIARVLDLPLSPSLSLVSPPVRPSSASSRSLLPLFCLAFSFSLFLPLSPCLCIALSSSHSHLCTSAFLTAERRTGFRRKETTIQRIVATDHSWRVDRINDVS